jgi:phosphocarrier protein HPr
MGLMMLAASKGCQIEIETTGGQEESLAAALKALLADYFGEVK